MLWLLHCAHAAVQKQTRLSHYAVHLVPDKPLLFQLNAASSIRQDGRIFHGFTQWQVTWNFRWKFDGQGTCQITDVKTLLTIDFIMPRAFGGSPSQRQQLDPYIRALQRHEDGHALIGERVAAAIDKAIAELPAMRDCQTLEATANAKGHELLEVYKEVNRRYDLETEHGKTQGAQLNANI